MSTPPVTPIHQAQPVLHTGAPLDRAQAAMILVHGRGASAREILTLVPEFDRPGFAYLAPQAAGHTWYPLSFLSPIARNEPYLSSALARLDEVVNQVVLAGIPPQRVVLLGFSQGACLSAEYVARHARRYGGLAVLSGGLIGPDGAPRDYPGALDGTPVFLGCSDVDFHIPKERVLESADVFRRLGGEVTARLYPGLGHTVNQDEIDAVRAIMTTVLNGGTDSPSPKRME